jgi:catechol 2,3-dioxygenase-like lactoylglutathione lyase family enzyme
MIDSLGGMIVIVSDQQKAIEFYTQKLGFELRSDTPFGGAALRVSDGLKLHRRHHSQLLVLWYRIL